VRGALRKDIMDEFVLQADKREAIGKKVKGLRREGKLPAIIYGHGIDPIPISMDYRQTTRSLSSITSSSLVVVEVGGDKITTLIRDRQFDPVTGNLLHVDFLSISMTEKLRTDVGLDFVGDAPAVKNFGGVLVTGLEALEVECFPQDLPDKIDVDISVLEEIGDSLYVRDLTMPEGVELITSEDEMLILVTTPAVEPVEEEVEEEVEFEEGEEPELVDRGRDEEEIEDGEA